VQANPACGKVTDLNDVQNLRQYASVTQGTHSIQTILYSYGNGGTVQAWETDYTIYIGK
jgi:hypothetical protein